MYEEHLTEGMEGVHTLMASLAGLTGGANTGELGQEARRSELGQKHGDRDLLVSWLFPYLSMDLPIVSP